MAPSGKSILPPLLDRESGIPIYRQIERHFSELIRNRRIEAHTPIPRAVELAERLGISHLTVRQSYK